MIHNGVEMALLADAEAMARGHGSAVLAERAASTRAELAELAAQRRRVRPAP